MSKKSELATQQGGALATSQYARDYKMEGEDSGDAVMPRVILHQGDISEKYYGQHPKGTLLHSITGEVIEARRFTPLGIAWKEWMKFGDKFGDTLDYKTRNKSEVPPEDLQWNGNEPPAASLFYNFVVLFEGMDSPVCLSMKASSKFQRSAAQALNQMEKIRGAKKLAPGLYELDIVDRENDKGKWKDLKLRPVGNPSDDLAKASYEFYQALSGKHLDVHQDKEPEPTDAYDPDKDG